MGTLKNKHLYVSATMVLTGTVFFPCPRITEEGKNRSKINSSKLCTWRMRVNMYPFMYNVCFAK